MKNTLFIVVILLTTTAFGRNEVSFPCFETMANIYTEAKTPAAEITLAKDKAIIEKAVGHAVGGAKAQVVKTEVAILANSNLMYGIKVTVGDDPEYQDYYLFQVANELELLSKHDGDDQGPEITVYCKGWSEGLVIK